MNNFEEWLNEGKDSLNEKLVLNPNAKYASKLIRSLTALSPSEYENLKAKANLKKGDLVHFKDDSNVLMLTSSNPIGKRGSWKSDIQKGSTLNLQEWTFEKWMDGETFFKDYWNGYPTSNIKSQHPFSPGWGSSLPDVLFDADAETVTNCFFAKCTRNGQVAFLTMFDYLQDATTDLNQDTIIALAEKWLKDVGAVASIVDGIATFKVWWIYTEGRKKITGPFLKKDEAERRLSAIKTMIGEDNDLKVFQEVGIKNLKGSSGETFLSKLYFSYEDEEIPVMNILKKAKAHYGKDFDSIAHNLRGQVTAKKFNM